VVGLLLVLLALVSTGGAGLELDLARLRSATPWRAALGRALVGNLVVVPSGTFVLLRMLDVPADVGLALWLVALAPGGASAPLLARLAGGEPTRVGVLYVALCASALLVLPVMLPVVTDTHIPAAHLLAVTVGLQLLPLVLGIALRRQNQARALRQAAALRRFGSLLLVLVVLLLLVTRGAFLTTLSAATLLALLAMVLLSLSAGALLAPAPRLPDALLACVRNLTLALLVAESAQPGGTPTLIIAAYGLVMYVGAAASARWFAARPPLAEQVP
jgi:BASS family bile acid:Na+ symporter